MKLKLNLLTGKVNDDALNATSVNKEEFWQYYLKAVNMVKPILTDREIDFMAAFCINNEPKYLQERLKISAPNYYGMVKRLVDKGLLINTAPYELHPTLAKIVNYVNKAQEPEITIVFPLKIE